jgi:membrane fusion protein, multidrug efflux system
MASAPSVDAQAPANTRDGAPPPPLPGHGSSDLSPGTSPTAGGDASALLTNDSEGIPAGPNGADPSPARSAEADRDTPLARPKPPTSARRWLAPLLGLAALAGGGAYLVAHWGLVETDNAQLQGHLTEISSRVPGTIARVLVEDNQEVKLGQPLLQLDDRDARARLFKARADLEQVAREAQAMAVQAGASVSTARAAEGMAEADQQSASSELARAAADAQRLVGLAQQGGVSRQEAERAVSTYRKAQADFTFSQASRQTAQARIQDVGVDRQKAAAAQAKVMQAQAAFAQAQLDLSYTRITAPSAGRIGSRHAEPGRQVQPGQPLMTVVDTHPWVEANFKETQLTALKPGQAAEVRIDAYPNKLLRGKVNSLAPAAGSRFALLPPDNASGNFTKVVQRITARIDLDPRDTQGLNLVPGLSATVSVRRP